MRLLVVLAGLLAVLTVTSALANGRQRFSLVNSTGYGISEVYISPSKARDWQEDLLGQGGIPNGDQADIDFQRTERICVWDLKVVYDDGESAEWSDFDLCTISFIEISYNRKTGETWATWK